MTDSVVPDTGADTVPATRESNAGYAACATPDSAPAPRPPEDANAPDRADDPDHDTAGPLAALASAQTDLVERVDDLTRVLARQAATIERIADDAKARDRRERQGADLPLVTELFALLGDTVACADTAESPRERAAFEAVAARIERLLTGRGGRVVAPAPGADFDSLSMEAADVVTTDDPAADRTVDSVVQPGLSVPGRSVRPARVVVRRHR